MNVATLALQLHSEIQVKLSVQCETVDVFAGIICSTVVDIKRIEQQDDGTFTVVINAWPVQERIMQS